MKPPKAIEYGVRFETGVPVEVRFVRNAQKSPPATLRDDYQQRIEPAGRYVIHVDSKHKAPAGWEHGKVKFKNPLVLAFNLVPGNIYDEGSWKRQLERHYRKRGRALSRAIVKEGYDGIVTVVGPHETREIVDLTWLVE